MQQLELLVVPIFWRMTISCGGATDAAVAGNRAGPLPINLFFLNFIY